MYLHMYVGDVQSRNGLLQNGYLLHLWKNVQKPKDLISNGRAYPNVCSYGEVSKVMEVSQKKVGLWLENPL